MDKVVEYKRAVEGHLKHSMVYLHEVELGAARPYKRFKRVYDSVATVILSTGEAIPIPQLPTSKEVVETATSVCGFSFVLLFADD